MAIVDPKAEAVFQKLKKKVPMKWANRLDTSLYFEDKLPEQLVRDCESPIEQMLLVALEFMRPDLMFIQPQADIIWYKDFPDQTPYKFRADFVVGLDWTLLTPEWEYAARGGWWDSGEAYPSLPFFAIECDGRDYHNQHEAIERDKQRDRIFASRGMPVLRFTGSEIYNDTEGCAKQVVEMFLYMLRERLKPGVWQEELIPTGSVIVLGKRWKSE